MKMIININENNEINNVMKMIIIMKMIMIIMK